MDDGCLWHHRWCIPPHLRLYSTPRSRTLPTLDCLRTEVHCLSVAWLAVPLVNVLPRPGRLVRWSLCAGLLVLVSSRFCCFPPCFWVDHAVHAVLSRTVHLIAIVLFHAPTPSRQGFLTWVPHACKLRYLDTKDIEKCMSGVTGTPRTITYVGDSRARTQVRYLSITRAHMPKY